MNKKLSKNSTSDDREQEGGENKPADDFNTNHKLNQDLYIELIRDKNNLSPKL
jgi:hypothetical protein